MKRFIMIAILACLAIACVPSDGTQADVSTAPASAVFLKKSTGFPAAATTATSAETVILATTSTSTEPASTKVPGKQGDQFLELDKSWPSGAELQKEVEGFMNAGFMKDPMRFGFGDLAYSNSTLDCTTDDQGKITQINGVFSDMYDKYLFTIPVVNRIVDAISGSRQVNYEDVIVQLEAGRWSIQPVSLKGGSPFEVGIDSAIEFVKGNTSIRIVKTGSVFACTETLVKADGQEELQLSWEIDQYELGPVRKIRSVVKRTLGIPVVLSWEPSSLAGYIASIPEGRAEYVQRLGWEPSGELEIDRYNFLVLLTQSHGSHLSVPEALGVVDPVWLALLMYDHVVNP